MILPAGHRVLVRRDKVEDHDPVYKSARQAGLVLADTEDAKRRQAGIDKGVVVSIGPTAFKAFGDVDWCSVGDLVVFAKYAGKVVTDPEDKEQEYIVLNDEDVVAVLRG